MSHVTNLYFSEFDINVDYLKQLKPMGHLSSSYLHVLLHTARFKTLKPGERISSREMANYFVYLVDGCVERPQQKVMQHIQCRGCEPLFEEQEATEIVGQKKSMLLMIDRTLFSIFQKENNFRERLNMAENLGN